MGSEVKNQESIVRRIEESMKKSLVTTIARVFVISMLCGTAVVAQAERPAQEPKPAVSPSPAVAKTPGEYGVVTGSVYHNSYLGLRITIPPGWTVQGEDAKQKIVEESKTMLPPKNEREKAEREAIAARSAILLTISKLPLETSEQANAILIAMAESVPPSLTTPIYMKQLKGFLQRAPFPVNFGDDDQVETINGVQFHTLTAILSPTENSVRQKYYVLIKKGYALGLITSIISDSDTAAMNSILKSVTVQ